MNRPLIFIHVHRKTMKHKVHTNPFCPTIDQSAYPVLALYHRLPNKTSSILDKLYIYIYQKQCQFIRRKPNIKFWVCTWLHNVAYIYGNLNVQESPPQNSPKLSYKPFIKCILYDICMICISHITKNKHHAQSQFSGFSYYDFSSTNHHVFQKNDEHFRLHLRGSLRSLHFLLPLPLFLLGLLSDDFWRRIGRWENLQKPWGKKPKDGGFNSVQP